MPNCSILRCYSWAISWKKSIGKKKSLDALSTMRSRIELHLMLLIDIFYNYQIYMHKLIKIIFLIISILYKISIEIKS
jgi:hypothetical protein